MKRVKSWSVMLTILVVGMGRSAGAYPVSRGTSELRPLIGVTARLAGQPSQFQTGLDYAYSLNGPTSLVFGTWIGVADEYLGLELHLGVKHRFLRLHRRIAPFLWGGIGMTTGIPGRGGQALLGLGFRFGGGIDFFATPRIIPGFQIVFDVGPRFTPDAGALGSAQITFGVGFLL